MSKPDMLHLRRFRGGHHPAFDADRKRLDLGESIDELTRFPLRAQALRWIILGRLR